MCWRTVRISTPTTKSRSCWENAIRTTVFGPLITGRERDWLDRTLVDFAVLVAEDLSGRYKTVIETLPQYLPFIGIEIRALKLPYQGGVATIYTSIVAQPDDLLLNQGDEPEDPAQEGEALF